MRDNSESRFVPELYGFEAQIPSVKGEPEEWHFGDIVVSPIRWINPNSREQVGGWEVCRRLADKKTGHVEDDVIYKGPMDCELFEQIMAAHEIPEFSPRVQVGDVVRVVKRLYGHEFEIGEVVRLTYLDEYDTGACPFTAVSRSGKWWYVGRGEVRKVMTKISDPI